MSFPQFALVLSGLAIVWTIRRWRLQVIKNARNRTVPDTTLQSRTAEGSAAMLTLPTRHMRDVTYEMQALLAELEETSRRLTAQLDNRYTRLEQLLAEADAKIGRLDALTGKTPPAKNAIAATAPAHAALVALSDAERTLQQLRNERGAPPPAQDPAYQPIYSLSDLGKSPREIAQQLDRQPGEIELILALRSR